MTKPQRNQVGRGHAGCALGLETRAGNPASLTLERTVAGIVI